MCCWPAACDARVLGVLFLGRRLSVGRGRLRGGDPPRALTSRGRLRPAMEPGGTSEMCCGIDSTGAGVPGEVYGPAPAIPTQCSSNQRPPTEPATLAPAPPWPPLA